MNRQNRANKTNKTNRRTGTYIYGRRADGPDLDVVADGRAGRAGLDLDGFDLLVGTFYHNRLCKEKEQEENNLGKSISSGICMYVCMYIQI